MPDTLTMRWLVGGVMLIVIAGGAIVAFRRRGPLIAPHREHRFIPWSGLELALSLFIYVAFQSLPLMVLQKFGLIKEADHATSITGHTLYKLVWASVLIGPWTVPAILLFLWARSQTKPRHVGLTKWRWRESLALGYASFAVVAPMVYGVNFLAYQVVRWTGSHVQPHPLQRLVESGVSPLAIALTAFQAAVLAPIVEEFVFRGVMLPWLSQRYWGGWLAMVGGIAIGLGNLSYDGAQWNWTPLGFVVCVSALGYLFTRGPGRVQWNRRAIVGTAILFAMLHVNVWPQPVPLLVLGLGLGWCAYRSRSLIAPITLHALFNGTSMLLMLLGVQGTLAPKNRPQEQPSNVTETEAWTPPQRLGHSMSEPQAQSPDSDDHGGDKPARSPAPGGTNSPMK